MSNSPTFEILLEKYNEMYPDLKLSISNDCASFCIDNKFDLHIVFFDETQHVHIVSYIKIITDEERFDVYEILLEANYLSILEGVFSITPDKKYIAYTERYPIYNITPFELDTVISRVIRISHKTLNNKKSI